MAHADGDLHYGDWKVSSEVTAGLSSLLTGLARLEGGRLPTRTRSPEPG